MRSIAARDFSTAWKTFFHGVEKNGKVFTFYVKIAQSFYVLRKNRLPAAA